MSDLALLGGQPVRSEPFPEWPIVEESDVQAVAEVVRSGAWGRLGANQVHEFEKAFAAYQGAAYGLSVNSGGVALELALMCLHLPRGAEVLVPAYTYMATATCILRAGLTPVFVDIHEDTYNIDPNRLESAVTDQTGAILVVHFGGLSCDMDAILAVAATHDLRVVEDSAHAHGATWRNRGLGTIGDVGCFSFQASKNLNAGEGGMLLTNDAEIYTRAIEYHDLWAGGMLEREGQIGQGSILYRRHPVHAEIKHQRRQVNYQLVGIGIDATLTSSGCAARKSNNCYKHYGGPELHTSIEHFIPPKGSQEKGL